MNLTPQIRVWKKLNPTAPYVVDFRVDGKRRRKYFATKSEAKAAKADIEAKVLREGVEALNCPNSVRIQALEAQQILAPFPGKTIVDAAKHYAAYLESLRRSVSVRQLVGEYLAEVGGLNRSAVHLSDLRGRYETFCADFGDSMTRDIDHKQLRTWINDLDLSDVSKNNFRARLSSLFRFGIREGYMDVDPCSKITDKKIKFKPPTILTVDALSKLLEAADYEILPMVAIGSFAGLRTAELMRLTWEDVNLVTGLIKVGNSKNTSSRRFVPIQRNLAQWLAPYSGSSGPVWIGDINSFMRAKAKLTAEAGVEWPHNSSRHSFCSYALAGFNDLNQLRNDMGHASNTLIWKTYRELVTPDEGLRYFELSPRLAANVVAMS